MSAAGPEFYDGRYIDPGSAALLPVMDSPLWALYNEVRRWLPSNANITDLGCGTGPLMEALYLQAHTGNYEGIDFSPEGIAAARRRQDTIGAFEEEVFLCAGCAVREPFEHRCHGPIPCFCDVGCEGRVCGCRECNPAEPDTAELLISFEQGDLREWEPPEDLHNRVFVSLETLEHLDDDLALVARIPPGRRFIFSVPTFDSESHVRHFSTVGAVWERYSGLLLMRRWSWVQAGENERGVVYALDTIRRSEAWE